MEMRNKRSGPKLKLTEDKRSKVIEAWKCGWSLSEIAKAFGVSRTTIHNIVRKWEQSQNG